MEKAFKSFWVKDNTGDFSNNKNDTFDPNERCIGKRLMQGVPLLDSDWNEMEDIRRYQEWVLRKEYIGNGSPDGGFVITALEQASADFEISKGRFLVDGLEAVNLVDDVAPSWSESKGGAKFRTYTAQNILDNKEVYTDLIKLDSGESYVYLDVWVEELKYQQKNEEVKKLSIVTCTDHVVKWIVRVFPTDTKPADIKGSTEGHHYHKLATIQWSNKTIIGPKADKKSDSYKKSLFESIDRIGAKATNADSKATNADSKATNAETKATNAETKATNADSKATNAETKATNAETKAASANTEITALKGKLKLLVNCSALKSAITTNDKLKEAFKEYLEP